MANTWDPEYWADEPELIGGSIIGQGTPTPSLSKGSDYGVGETNIGIIPFAPGGAISTIGKGVAKAAPLIGAALLGDLLDPTSRIPGANVMTGMPGQTPGLYSHGSPVPLVGPGLKEPPAWMVAKEWHIRGGHDGRVTAQMYLLIDGRIASYNKGKGTWKVWRPKKNIVLSSNPRCKDLIKADKKIDNLMKRLAKRAGLVKRGSARKGSKRVAIPAGTQIISVD